MRRRSPLLLPLLTLVGYGGALAGCGGGGGAARPATDATRSLVARTIVDVQSSLGHSALEASFLPIFGVDAGSEPLLPPDVGDVLGGAPETPIPDFYYSDGVLAWIQVTRTDRSYREDYYLDEAKTQKAGFYESGDDDHYEFTAGPYAGARGDATYAIQDFPGEDRDVFRQRYRKVAPDGTGFEGEFTYVGLDETFKGKTTHPDGRVDTFDGQLPFDRPGKLAFRSGRGTILNTTFPDGAGTSKGTIRGTVAGLNADFSIDEENAMTIRFADGTKQTFEGAGGRGKDLARSSRSRARRLR